MRFDNNEIKFFEGEFLHPSLDIKDNILTLGFCYRSESQKDKVIFVIAHNGDILTTDKELFDLNGKRYYFELRKRKLARLEEKWSAPVLRQFLNDYGDLKEFAPSGRGIFEEVVALLKRYIELEKDIYYYLLTAWAIGTYFSPMFYAYPFLHIKAPKRSGKSQCLNFLAQICFNAVKARPTLAAFGDTVDSLRGTYLIDQADALGRHGYEELLDLLADSYKQSGGKRRVMNFEKRTREILELETYSPKVFASIRELPEDLADRCFIVPLIRSKRNFPDPDEESELWRELRGEIYKLLLTSYTDFRAFYTFKRIQYRQEKEMLGRTLELWLPFEVVLECCGMQEIIQEARGCFLKQYGFSEYEPSEREAEVIKTILNQLQEQQEIILTPKEISELMDTEFFSARETPKQRAAKVGWAIKTFNLASEKKTRTKDGVRYLFEKNKVQAIYDSYFKTANEPTPLTPEAPEDLNPEQIAM